MAVDPYSFIYTNIWNVLNANDGFLAAFQPGNQIRYDAGGDVLRPEKLIEETTDYPKIEIKMSAVQDTGFSFDPSMDMENEGFTGGFVSKINMDFQVTITTPEVQYTTLTPNATPGATQNLYAFTQALLSSGPKMGLSQVTTWGPLTTRRKSGIVASGNASMMVEDTIQLPVRCTFNGNNGVLIIP